MSEHDCPLTPAQRAAYRDWQVREVLRRRAAGKRKASVGVAAAGSPGRRAGPGPATRARECPDCGKPYGKRARCYSCRPGGVFGSRS